MRALCHEVTNGPRGIVETKRECCQGIPGEVFLGERLLSGKLHHDIGEREGKVAQILLGWSGSKEGIELALQPLIVKAEELVAPGGVGVWCV